MRLSISLDPLPLGTPPSPYILCRTAASLRGALMAPTLRAPLNRRAAMKPVFLPPRETYRLQIKSRPGIVNKKCPQSEKDTHQVF